MFLYELLEVINDNAFIEIFNAESCDEIGRYDGKESIDESYDYCEVMDVWSYNYPNEANSVIGIDIEIESEDE